MCASYVSYETTQGLCPCVLLLVTETMQGSGCLSWSWLPDYAWYALKMDFIAGISVGLTVIPQALAYAEWLDSLPQVRWLPLLPPTSFPLSLTPPDLTARPGAE